MGRFAFRSRRTYIVSGFLGLGIIGILFALASFLTSAQYSAVASAIQAAAVVPAIAIAASALLRDSHDRRVDRVLDFHRELTSGEVLQARDRLGAHLRKHGVDGRVRPTSRDELRDDLKLSRYSTDHSNKPRSDVNVILRFFERVNAARIAATVDYPLLAELIGRHAAWWNLAIKDPGDDEVPRAPLRELATWADEFVLANQDRYSYLRNWGSNRQREFRHATFGSENKV